mmetsp:Transcript_4710/g.7159  ORF Transcript_4710/g.7159 Transcript_4710/m.7159 type:complete len:330 (+) Transcript_4710:122-1111(+)
MSGVKINAAEVADPYLVSLAEEAAHWKNSENGPLLVGFLANEDPAAIKYAEWTKRSCESTGIAFELRKVSESQLEWKLYEANEDHRVHGIIIYYPVFGQSPSFYGGSMDDYLRDSVSYKKDVEGLCFTYRYNLYRNVRYMDEAENLKSVLPCTPLACVKVLEHLCVYDRDLPTGNRMYGKVVTIINRSEIVGRPLAAMLANDGADIYSVDIDSIYFMRRGLMEKPNMTLEQAVRMSDVVVTGVPTPSYRLPVEWIKPNTVVINVSSFKNMDSDDLLRTVPGVRYIPQVGKVTVTMLERNLLRLYKNYHSPDAISPNFTYCIEPRPPNSR